MNAQPMTPEELRAVLEEEDRKWLQPLPLKDPQLSHLSQGQINLQLRRFWTEYDWHDKWSQRAYRAKLVEQMKRAANESHPVLVEWSFLQHATKEEYQRHTRNLMKRIHWENRFRGAKTTEDRYEAARNLRRYTLDTHPIVVMYLNRHKQRPESRKGWWELEPPKKPRRRGTKAAS